MNKKLSIRKMHYLTLFFAIPILAVFLLTFSVNVKADEIEFDNSLPFQYQLTATYNAQWNETLYNYFVSANLPIDDPDYVLIYRDWASYGFDGNYYNVYYYFYLLPIASFDSVNNYNTFDISTDSIGFSLVPDKPSYNVTLIVAYYRSGNTDSIYTGRVYNSNTNLGNNFSPTLFGHAPTSTTINNGYNFTSTSMCPVYFTKRFLNVDDMKILTMGSGEDDLFLGHATAPGEFSNPTVNSGSNHTLPREVPDSPTYNSYTWNTYNPPSIDTTNVESLLESLIYVINYLAGWLSNNLSGEFANLISNFSLFFDYIAETIQYYGGLIISNIQNGIETFYNNMVSLFEPMFEPIFKIGLFFSTFIGLGTAPGTDEFSIPYLAENLFMPDPEDVQEIMETNDSLHIISNLDRIVDKVWTSETSIIKTLHNVTPVKKFHIPSCIYHGVQIGNYDIEFGWFENYKTYSDSIISTFLIIAWIYWFFVSVSHIIRYGKTYDVDDTTKGVHF